MVVVLVKKAKQISSGDNRVFARYWYRVLTLVRLLISSIWDRSGYSLIYKLTPERKAPVLVLPS